MGQKTTSKLSVVELSQPGSTGLLRLFQMDGLKVRRAASDYSSGTHFGRTEKMQETLCTLPVPCGFETAISLVVPFELKKKIKIWSSPEERNTLKLGRLHCCTAGTKSRWNDFRGRKLQNYKKSQIDHNMTISL